MCWSPNSRRLVFKGKLPDKHEIAIINTTGQPNLKKYTSTQHEMGNDLAWSPDGQTILFSMHSREHARTLIHRIDLLSDDPPKIVPEANTSLAWESVCFSPDGKWIVASTPN
jgi:Tol biopolymer transport system component